MSPDYNDCVTQYCELLRVKSKWHRDMADLLDTMAERMMGTAEYCEKAVIEDAMNGRR